MTTNKRIMVVEDEGVTAMGIKVRLEEMGYNVTSVEATAEGAVIKASEEKPDLVLMDILLGGKMDGIEAAGQIYSRYNIPVVYITAHSDEKIVQRIKETEPFGYIIKPFDEQELAIAVEIALYKHSMEMKLRESEEKYRRFFSTVSNGWAYHKIIVDGYGKPVDFVFLEVNPAFEALTGLNRENIIGKRVTEVLPGIEKDPADWIGKYGDVALYGKSIKLENFSKNTGRWYSVSAASPEKGYFITVFDDITERKKIEQRLQELTMTDELTGMLNRRGFFTLAEQQCKLSDRTGIPVSLLYIDLDGFKTINDELGHDEGDQALIDAANILRKTFRESDIIARIGGDEFVVLLTDPSGPDIEDIVFKHVKNNLGIYNEQSGRNYALIFSMGVAHYDPEHPCSISELLTQADELMYEDKKRHKLEKPLRPSRIEKAERRAYMRHKSDDNCRAELENTEKAGIKDISASGICLKLSRQLTVDSIHKLHLSPSSDSDIVLNGKVVWSSMTDTGAGSHLYEAGINFINANAASRRFLDKFISANLPE